MDPVADKILIGALTVCLGMDGVLPTYFVGAVLGRDVALVGGGFVYRAATKPKVAFINLFCVCM